MRLATRLAVAAAVLVVACGAPTASIPPTPISSPTEQAPGSPRVTPTPAPTPDPSPTPTPDPRPLRCRAGDQALTSRLSRLKADIEAAMATYPGGWGVALVDLDCRIELAVKPEHFQYTASAGKIVPVIAALRAVDESKVTLPRPWKVGPFACGIIRDPGVRAGDPIAIEDLEPALFLVTRHSCDQEADLVNDMVTPKQIADVLEIAKVSDRAKFEHSWRFGGMTALDLARVWAALLDGRLLGPGLTTYLLDLTSRAEIPSGLDTFPAAPEIAGYQFGQKAGYCIVCPPYSLIALGAGYLRPIEQLSPMDSVGGTRARPQRGVAMVLMAQTTARGGGPQRRDVFPLLAAYVLGED